MDSKGKEKHADELFKEFKETSITEFFRKNRAHLGYSGSIRSLTTVVHEIVTNSLDACEEAGIQPEILIEIRKLGGGHYTVRSEDNGPGIPIKHISGVFGKMLAGTKFHRNIQLRGQQGIGVSTPYETLVFLGDGRIKPIGELVEGDYSGKVLSFDEKDIIKGEVSKCIKNPKKKEFIKIKTFGNLELILTPEHMLLAKENIDSEPIHIAAEGLDSGMFLPLALSEHDVTNPHETPIPIFDMIDNEKYRVYERGMVLDTIEKLKDKYESYGGVHRHFGIPKERLRGWYRDREFVANPSITTLKKFALDLDVEMPVRDRIKIGNYHHKIKLPSFVDEDLCWLMGFLASDGHINEGKNKWGTLISVTNKNNSLLEKTRDILNKLELRFREYEYKGTALHFSSLILADIAHKFGIPSLKKSDKIEMPDFILQLPNRLLRMYVIGLFDGDGSITIGKRNLAISLTTKSERLARSLQLVLLTRFGIFNSLKISRDKRGEPVYAIAIYSREFMSRFLHRVGFTDHKKLNEMRKLLKNNPGKSVFCVRKEDGFWVRVKSVERIRLSAQPTYDLSIKGNPYFAANGLVIHNSGVTLFSQTTTGRPIKIKTSTGKGKVNEIELMIDITKNRADILSNNEYSQYWRGTEIQCELKGVNFTLREQGPFEYLRRTAIANPHAKITFVDPEGRKTAFEKSTEKVPKPPVEIKPHPKGIEVDDLVNMTKFTDARKVSSFLTSTFSRMSNAKAKEIQDIINEGEAPFDLNKSPKKLSWAECEQIVRAIEQIKFLAPPTEGLQPISEEQIRKAVLNILDPEFEAVLTRNPTSHSGGVPFQIEVAIAYGGQAGRNIGEGTKVETMRFANRAPLLFDSGACAITKAVNSVEWKRYGIRDFDNSPITILVNVVSTYIPYTSAGKQSVADDEEIMKEIRMGLMDVGRKFQIFHSRQRRAIEKEARKQILMHYSIELAAGLAKLTDKDEKKILKKLNELVLEKLKLEEEMEKLDEEEEKGVENGFDGEEVSENGFVEETDGEVVEENEA